MKRETIAWLLSLMMAGPFGMMTSCSSDDTVETTGEEACSPLLLTGIVTSIEGSTSAATRAAAVDSDYVGRSAFVDADQLCFTTIRRTNHPAATFTYTDMPWKLQDGLWSSIDEEQKSIYWSDANSPHTFVGYSLPQGFGNWSKSSTEESIYYGCLGYPDASDALDFTSTFQKQADGSYQTDANGNPLPDEEQDGAKKLAQQDVVLTYRTDMTAEEGGSKALIHFRHALSQVCIEVYIGGFSAGVDVADNEAVVSNLLVKEQPVLYQWKENDEEYKDGAKALTETDGTVEIGETTVEWNKKRDVKPWIRKPQGVGKGVDKKYIYRMLAVPGTRTEYTVFTFDVTYPNPLNDSETLTANYKATLSQTLTLKPGTTTLIKIQLNHLDSEPTVGAEYVDWEFTPTPDRGELTKNATFLDSVEKASVKLSGDEGVTADDATWLFKDNGTALVDRLGNDGSMTQPYKITTAAQLLAFAFEVNGGMDFTGKYVRLDASLVLQPFDTFNNPTADHLVWPGIGTKDHPFKGVFFGGQGSLSHLYGNPLFGYVDETGWLEQVTLTEVLGITSGGGILADVNKGLFCACRVEGDISSGSEKVGGLVGENSGNIVLSTHLGDVKGTTQVGGLAGTNSGYIAVSFHAGAVTGSESAFIAGIANNSTLESTPNVKTAACYYDMTLCPTVTSTADTSEGKSTTDMQSKSFVETLNNYYVTETNYREFYDNYLNSNIKEAYRNHVQYGQIHQFIYSPLQYPRIDNTTYTPSGGE